ncbi:hypothetical protein [Brevundimonas sp.]|uniref:hypothetical protein n=1 Tax=Brevundimonas sp. TaxID=1871086 RepID=UPI001D98CE7D|nr:hypothetical protein [Brevundimonas sp.]MBL0948420.1 hypothetical protein [Brevundimonas sp.]
MQTIRDIHGGDMGSEARFAGRGLVRSDRAVDAFQTVAWRAPEPRRDRFMAANVEHARAANEEIPHWMILVGGGLFAALMGALLGGAMAL